MNLIGTEDENPEKYFVEERHWLCVSKKGVILERGNKNRKMEMEISKQSSRNTNDQRVNIYIYIYSEQA